jgi:LysM repeat protein
MRQVLFKALPLIAFLAVGASLAPRSSAQVGEPWQLVAEVNALRASYGLPPYEVDNALMAAAQAHSEYQAQLGSWTHSGPGGSRPHDRAVAAGYGGGAQVYVSENVAMGADLSPSTTVYQLWQDAVHLETMISPNYRHIGAGVAESGGQVFYTIDVGYIEGNPGSGAESQPAAAPTLPGGTPAPTAIALVPITVATPNIDGSIVHVVQYGQFLENIANAYGIPLQDLLAQNYINQNTVIFPGDKIVIEPSTTQNTLPTGTGPPSQTGTSISNPTGSPSRTPTTQLKRPTTTPSPIPATPVALVGVAEPVDPASAASDAAIPSQTIDTEQSPDYLLIIVFVLAVAGGGLIALGSAVKRAA